MKHGNETHGHTKLNANGLSLTTPEYRTWQAMKSRCNTPGASAFKKYGAKGISVCQRWQESFEAFLEDMGPRPTTEHSIDRIDSRGNYEPSNCRWATRVEQANNVSSNRILECDGRSMTLAQWSRESGVDADVIALRIDRNSWDVKRAIFTHERSAASGLKGIYWQKERGRWSACFTKNKVLHNLGRFDNLFDAAATLISAKNRDFETR